MTYAPNWQWVFENSHWVQVPVGVPTLRHGPSHSHPVPMGYPAMAYRGNSSNSNSYSNVVPYYHAPQFPVGHPSMAGRVGLPAVGYGSSAYPVAQPYQPQYQHGSGNSYALPKAVHSGPAPQAHLGTHAPSKANTFVLDSRHGTLAPKTKRERRKLARKVKKEAEASKAAMASKETVGDGVTSSPEREGEEEDDDNGSGYAGYGLAIEALGSRELEELQLIHDTKAAAQKAAIIEEGARSPS